MSIRKFENKKGITYEVRFNYKDKYGRKKYYSKRGFKSLREAKKHENYFKAKFEDGYEKKEIKTVNEVFFEMLNSNNNIWAYSTKQSRKLIFNKHIDPVIGKCEINKVDYKIITSIIKPLEEKYTTSTIEGIVATLKSVFNYAYNIKYIDRLPFLELKIRGKEKENSKDKIITDEQFEQLISFCGNSLKEQSYKIAFYIARYTGCRLGEILALHKDDINFNDNTISINKTLYHDLENKDLIIKDVKTKSSNAILPMANILKNILQDWFKVNQYDIVIIDNNGDYIDPQHVKAKLRRFSNKYSHINFHMFRHTYTTMLYKNGVDPKTAQQLLRHKDFNTTMSIYTHLDEKNLKDTIDDIFN